MFKTELAHLKRMATIPGWKAHAWHRAQQMDQQFPGISQALKDAMSSAKSEGAAPPRSR